MSSICPWSWSQYRIFKIGQFLCCLGCCTDPYLYAEWMVSNFSLHRCLPVGTRAFSPLLFSKRLDSFVLRIQLLGKYTRNILPFGSLFTLIICCFFIVEWKLLKGRSPVCIFHHFSLSLLLGHIRCLLTAWKVKICAQNTVEQACLFSVINSLCVSVWNLYF